MSELINNITNDNTSSPSQTPAQKDKVPDFEVYNTYFTNNNNNISN